MGGVSLSLIRSCKSLKKKITIPPIHPPPPASDHTSPNSPVPFTQQQQGMSRLSAPQYSRRGAIVESSSWARSIVSTSRLCGSWCGRLVTWRAASGMACDGVRCIRHPSFSAPKICARATFSSLLLPLLVNCFSSIDSCTHVSRRGGARLPRAAPLVPHTHIPLAFSFLQENSTQSS